MNAIAQHGPVATTLRRSLVTVKDLFWAVYLLLLRPLAAVLPPGLVRAAAGWLGPLMQILSRGRKMLFAKGFRRAMGPDTGADSAAAMAWQYIANDVRRCFDDLLLERRSATDITRKVELQGLDQLSETLGHGCGALLVTGHFHANRLGKRYLAEIGFPVLTVRNRAFSDPAAGRLGKRRLQPAYLEFLHRVIRDEVSAFDPQCTLKIFRRLRSGGLVSPNIDAGITPNRVMRPFLNGEKYFPTGVLEIARLSGCAVIPMLCLGDSRKLTIRLEKPVPLIPHAGKDEFVSANLPILVEWLETQVRRYPDQWDLWARM